MKATTRLDITAYLPPSPCTAGMASSQCTTLGAWGGDCRGYVFPTGRQAIAPGDRTIELEKRNVALLEYMFILL